MIGDMDDLIPVNGWAVSSAANINADGVTDFVYLVLLHQETGEQFDISLAPSTAGAIGWDLLGAAHGYEQ